MGWQFTLAEFDCGPLMIVFVALGFRVWMGGRSVEEARERADRGVAGSMEGHAAMDMSVKAKGSISSRLFSRDGVTAVSHCYVMDWASVLHDIAMASSSRAGSTSGRSGTTTSSNCSPSQSQAPPGAH